MKIGIHHQKGSYSKDWISYCEQSSIDYKVVNAYDSDIINQLNDCDIFMWHHHQGNPKDVLLAKELLFSLEQSGKIVYPNWKTGWHFDDKLGQKYLLEAFKLPLIPTYAFFTKNEALKWAKNFQFPAVFKLRGGASSQNVKLIRTKREAFSIIKKCFGRGFRQYSVTTVIKDKYHKFRKGQASLKELVKAIAHIVYPMQVEKSKGNEKGYAYFQQFIPDCNYDIRVQLIGNKCYAMTRYVRENDFRASGGGKIDYDGSNVPLSAIKLTFEVAEMLQMQSMAIDLLPHQGSYLIAEVSYAFGVDEGELDFGYYDAELNWHSGKINPYGWMIQDLILRYRNKTV